MNCLFTCYIEFKILSRFKSSNMGRQYLHHWNSSISYPWLDNILFAGCPQIDMTNTRVLKTSERKVTDAVIAGSAIVHTASPRCISDSSDKKSYWIHSDTVYLLKKKYRIPIKALFNNAINYSCIEKIEINLQCYSVTRLQGYKVTRLQWTSSMHFKV